MTEKSQFIGQPFDLDQATEKPVLANLLPFFRPGVGEPTEYFYISIVICVVIECHAAEQGDWLVRVRGIVVHPNDNSGLISLGGVPVTNTSVEVDTNVVPEVDVTCLLRKHWDIEVIAGITKA